MQKQTMTTRIINNNNNNTNSNVCLESRRSRRTRCHRIRRGNYTHGMATTTETRMILMILMMMMITLVLLGTTTTRTTTPLVVQALTPSSASFARFPRKPSSSSSSAATNNNNRHKATVSSTTTATTTSTKITDNDNNDNNKENDNVAVLDLETMTALQIERAIVQAGRTGRTDQALAMYAQLESPGIRQTNAAIDACARAHPVRLEQAFDLLQESSSSSSSTAKTKTTTTTQPNVYTFGSLMHACARAGAVTRAVQLLHDMRHKYHVTPNAVVYHAAVSACNRATPPAVDTAWQLLAQAQQEQQDNNGSSSSSSFGLALSTVGYNAALSAAARAGKVEQAVALFTDMDARTNPLVPAPDAVTYGTLLAAFERVQDWNKLLWYADRMQQAGFALDGLAITSILHACQQLGLARQAVDYFHRMKHVGPYRRQTAGNQVAGHRRPLQGPDAVAFILAISACARGGAWKQGLTLLQEYSVAGSPADVAVFTAAIRGCELAGEYPTAFLLLERMRQLKIVPNEMTFCAVLGACATAAAKTNSNDGDENENEKKRQAALSKALRLLRVLRKDPSTVDPNIQIYNAAIRVCAEAHQVEQAFALVDELDGMDNLEPNVVTYGTLMSACERAGSLEDVNKVFQRMRNDDIPANEVVYGAAISCCRKAGDPERALLLLRKMIRDDLKPNIVTFNTVLTAQVEDKGRGAQELERAMIVFKLLSSKKYSSASPNRQTYNLMIRFLAECQRPREAQVLLRKMRQDHDYVPDVHLYTAVVAAFERNGQPLKALRLMESMNADGYDFYEAKVLNAAFKRALKVANVMGRGFSGVHDDEEEEVEDEGDDDDDDIAAASALQSRVDSEVFVQGKKFDLDGDGHDRKLSP